MNTTMNATPKPYSIRIPPDMRSQINQLAEKDRRSQHSMILLLLEDALLMRHAAEQAPLSEAYASPVPPAPLSAGASQRATAH
jgi:hypothetical protein